MLPLALPLACSLTWIGISDVHFGHDVTTNGTVTTSLELNIQAALEINRLPLNASWPDSLGGGLVQPSVGCIVSGDLVDNGFTQGYELGNFSSVYGLTGKDGLLQQPLYEGRGNHDGGNSTDTMPHPVASFIAERNQVRKSTPSFNITNVSSTGLHYSWRWEAGCPVHFFMLNEYSGHLCDGCSPAPSCFYGKPCYTGWTFPEDSLGFLEATLPQVVGASGEPVFVIQHYCFDGYSNSWWSDGQREELYAVLRKFNTVGVLCGHTHSAAAYEWNGTATGESIPGGLSVYNIPSTQKEDSNGLGLPSEFFVFDISTLGTEAPGSSTLRVGHRRGYQWAEIMVQKQISCPSS